MNQSEDWDIIWRWQWFRRALWQPYFRDPSHPEGRPARLTPVWTHILQQYDAKTVLDCTCGMGLRAIILKEAGFEITGTDISPVAIQYARDLAEAGGHDIPFHTSKWQELGDRYEHQFDAVVNDAFSWTLSRTELRFAAHNFASVLKPGGVLIFTGADQWSKPEDKETHLEQLWQSGPRFQLRTDYENEGIHLSMVVARDKTEHGIVENYLFVINDVNGPRLETSSICNCIDWSWEDYQHVCKEAGFASLESIKIPVGRREHVFNVAKK
jgi:SAM-dependent methyltransferase